MAGYSGTTLPRKLGIGQEQRRSVIHESPAFRVALGPLPEGVERDCGDDRLVWSRLTFVLRLADRPARPAVRRRLETFTVVLVRLGVCLAMARR